MSDLLNNNNLTANENEQVIPFQCMKLLIQRDFSAGTIVKFYNQFPKELEGRINREDYEHTINTLNDQFSKVTKTTCCEGCLACMTACMIYMFMESHYEKSLRKISEFIAEENERIYHPKGLSITDPCLRDLRVLEISLLDGPLNTT